MHAFWSVPALLVLTAASPAPVVQVGTGEWSKLPKLDRVGYQHLSMAVMSKLFEVSRKNNCQLPGQRGMRLDLKISFAAEFDKGGQLNRLVLPPLNCPQAESWLGGTLLQSIKGGDYKPIARSPNGWYQGELSFYWEG